MMTDPGQERLSQQHALAALLQQELEDSVIALAQFVAHYWSTIQRENVAMSPEMTVEMKPPSAPMLGPGTKKPLEPATPLTLEPDPVNPEPDDIAEPEVPGILRDELEKALDAAPVRNMLARISSAASGADPLPGWVAAATSSTVPPVTFGEHEALLQGFCQALLKRITADMTAYGKEVSHDIETAWAYMRSHIETDKDRVRHAETALDALIREVVAAGIQVRQDPYQASVQAVSPQGFPVTLHIAKADTGALCTALPGLLGWLAQEGYTAR